ncbi:MAG: hypothetical protein R3A43_07575 [Bacteroidia bacterium]
MVIRLEAQSIQVPVDEILGLARLRKKVTEYGTKADAAIIYDKQTGNEIEKYFEELD